MHPMTSYGRNLSSFLWEWTKRPHRGKIVVIVMLGTLAFAALSNVLPPAYAQAARGKSALDHGKPHTYQPAATAKDTAQHPGHTPLIQGKFDPKADSRLHRPFTPSMQPLVLHLVGISGAGEFTHSAPQAAHALSSDGLIEVSVPATALTTADITASSAYQLVVDQVAAASGSTNGASGNGLISFGTYLFQVQDAQGHELANGQGLHQPITVTFHYPGKRSAIPLGSVVFDVNPAMPVTLPHPARHVGAHVTLKTTYDAQTNSLTTIVPMAASSGGGSFNTNAPVGYFGTPNAFQNDLHTGALTNTLPIDIPAGPGGLTPPIQLTYSSDAVNATHGPQATANWVGQGWNLDLGEVSWGESLDGTLANGNDKGYRSSWHISDPFGTSGDLIPPVTTVDTYYDDTINNPTTTPQIWHTATESFAKIVSYTNPIVDCTNFAQTNVCGHGGYTVQPPCYRAWLPNGVMEEFGCTPDSLQWYPNSISKGAPGSGTTNYVTTWKLDLITDPSGNQIHLHYDRDMATAVGGNSYPRDIVLANISWDSPSCQSASTYCPESGNGATWNPLMKVVFTHSKVATAAPGATVCTQSGSLRCDDPVAKTFPDIGTPLITATQVLNAIQVQVFASSAWNTLRTYTLKYGQGALNPNAIVDPFGGHSESVAGWLTLDWVQEAGADGTTYPAQTFAYTYTDTQYYEDSNYFPATGAGCGANWNTGYYANGTTSGCILWSRTYASFYMTGADNGLGLHQVFQYQLDRDNTHGVDPGNSATDPNYCTRDNTSQGASQRYPCDMPDDNAWSHETLIQRDATVGGATGNVTSTWKYNYDLATLTAKMCSDCAVGMYWGNANDGDAGDFYNGKFTGYAFAEVINPDTSLVNHYYNTPDGWGVWGSSVTCRNNIKPSPACPVAPSWDLVNATSGRETETTVFNPPVGGVYPKVQDDKTTFAVTCPPASYTSGNTSWNHNFVTEVDGDNPIAVCDVQVSQTDSYTYEGGSPSSPPHVTAANTYDNYGHVTDSTVTSSNGGATGSPTTIIHHTDYLRQDTVSTAAATPSGTYFLDVVDGTATQNPGITTRSACDDYQYDGLGYIGSGTTTSLTRALPTVHDLYATCGTPGNGWVNGTQFRTSFGYDNYGNQTSAIDPEGNAGNSSHKATSGACIGLTTCTTLDSAFHVLPTGGENAANQATSAGYTVAATSGWGLWPTSGTDANNQTSTVTYDGLGRVTASAAPGEANGTTAQMAYLITCTTSPSTPCLEVDHSQRLHDAVLVTSADYYDGWGQHVESRAPAPNGKDVITYARYDQSGHLVFQSLPYYVTHGTGYLTPDANKTGSEYTYDGLGRVIQVTDALSHTATTAYTVDCTVDSTCYERVQTLDALSHQILAFTDALGRTVHARTYTGTGPYTQYQDSTFTYDYNGNLVKTVQPDGTSQTTATFDAAGRMTAATDPDLGSYTYTYDNNGNEKSSVDPRGAAGTVYLGYDGLDRSTWVTNGFSPFASYTYDSGTNGVGRLTGESFASGPSQSITGSYAYTYDNRGQQTKKVITIAGTSKTFQMQFNDAGQQTQLTYNDGSTLTTAIDDSSGWTAGSTAVTGGTTYSLLNAIQYGDTSNFGGPAGHMTQASIGNGTYTGTWHYDGQLRLDEGKIVTGSTTLFDEQRGFDALSNVVTKATTIPQGTVAQTFCYDDRNRITWAGSTGTPSCGTPAPTGTFTNAQYSQSYTYDTLDRMTSGLKGTASFGNGTSQPLHALTSTTGGFSALYDAAGQMTCRAPDTTQTCSPTTQTGQTLSYDALNRLTAWQNQPTAPTSTARFAYDGSGERVWQQSVVSGTTTTTSYFGGLEEMTGTTTTRYFPSGPVTLETTGSAVSYLINDGLGSMSLSLSTTGSVLADALFKPFGGDLYHSSTMPTALGFTGQYNDATSGLDYYGARYYDPNVGQFISADTVQGPNRYGYVGWNPETLTDPTGHDGVVPTCECSIGAFGDGLDLSPPASSASTPMAQQSNNAPLVNGGDGGLNSWILSLAVGWTVSHLAHTASPETLAAHAAQVYWGKKGLTRDHVNEGVVDDAHQIRLTQLQGIRAAHVHPPTTVTTPTKLPVHGGLPAHTGVSPSNSLATTSSSIYEQMVRDAVGDTSGPNGHAWDGPQPARDVNGNLMRDHNGGPWAGPDAISGYGSAQQMWIDAKSYLPEGTEWTAKTRFVQSVGTYVRSGWPFEYWFEYEPSTFTREFIESHRGNLVIFP